ncbi:DUF92 domain-containing protein [Candidatus Marsarchaeota archaeon]|nr:DUF92 domain-containing protein [Candidatus Marsarchaeota archaeon]MCL5404868.1 DUF92 domain-containing protein [Candidatus Marsarchaeota archaeon]
MKSFLTLDYKATLVALGMGVVLLLAGGYSYGPYFFLSMLWFLLISAIATVAGTRYKKKKGLYEKSRGVKNVIANGILPVALALLYFFANAGHLQLLSLFAALGFVSAIAAVAADKFSSELGVLDGEPRSIITFKHVRKGTSGGITLAGLGAGLLGSLLITFSIYFGPLGASIAPGPAFSALILLTLVSGFLGTVFDSVLGVFEEQGFGNKFTSNFFAAVLAVAFSVIVAAATGLL